MEKKLDALKVLRDANLIDNVHYNGAVEAVLKEFVSETDGGPQQGLEGQYGFDTDQVEILIHNMSHSDMMMSLNHESLKHPTGTVVARPKFSNYRAISEKIWSYICSDAQHKENISLLNENLYRRSTVATEQGNYPLEPLPVPEAVPLGFQINTNETTVEDLKACHVRSGDALKLPTKEEGLAPCYIDAVYFPLLSVLIPKWLSSLESHGRGNCRKIVIVISGRGTPNNPSGNVIDNSTKATGKLAQLFFEHAYPSVQVVVLHSITNLFRYDENIVFVRRELVPLIDQIRNDLATKMHDKWREAMGITLSFADGSSARVSAINQSLRHYRPSYMHFWQLKTFWCENRLCFDDVESHSFEEISTEPAISVDQTSPPVMMIVSAMQQFRSEFERIMSGGDYDSDLASFWLRKTKKPVLAVLLVQKPGSAPRLYRGTNMEVSMPTGSLCAERNVIGSALADDITLRRQDLKMIAVYSAKSLVPEKAPALAPAPAFAALGSGSGRFKGEGLTVLTNSTHLRSPMAAGNGGRRNSLSPSDSADEGAAGSRHDSLSVTFDGVPDGGGKVGEVNSYGHTTGSTSPRSTGLSQKRKILNMPTISGGGITTGSSALRAKGLVGQGSPKRSRHKSPKASPHSNESSEKAQNEERGTASSTWQLGNSGTVTGEGKATPGASSTTGKANTRHIQESYPSPYLAPASEAGMEGVAGGAATNSKGGGDGLAINVGGGGTSIMPTIGSSTHSSMANLSDLPKVLGIGRLDTDEINEGFELCQPCGAGAAAAGARVIGGNERFGVDAASRGSIGSVGSFFGEQGHQNDTYHGIGGNATSPWTTRTRTIAVQEGDMNPLAPCGACKEWLKKIASVNPQFSVITFTDYECNGVYEEHMEGD